MAWNQGLSDGFWGAISSNVGQVIGAASGTTKAQSQAQIAMAAQERADKNNTMGLFAGLMGNNNSSSNSKLLPTGQISQQTIIIGIVILVVIMWFFMMMSRRNG